MATETMNQLDLGLVDPAAAVRALRDAQYDNTGKAIAELIDNSIDAGARRVELLIEERQKLVKKRRPWRVHKIAVADNGSGMDRETLVEALRVGGRYQANRTRTIGKYGMGLPTASASQCLLAEVWTWQKSIDQTLHSTFDVGGIIDGHVKEQPLPKLVPLPKEWRRRITAAGLSTKSGTLVVWTDFADRVIGVAKTLFRQVEEEVGRTYRYFIDSRRVSIRMARFRGTELEGETEVRANDPLFLMSPSATPAPWAEKPMFQEYGKPHYFTIPVPAPTPDNPERTREEIAEVRCSIVRPEVIIDRDEEGNPRAARAGSLRHGKFAAENMGVSIVRSYRELLLDRNFLPIGGGERENRWWGCEILFEPGLDEAFGVDHNKQMATIVSNAARHMARNPDLADLEAISALGIEEDDPAYPVYDMVAHIRRMTRNMLRDVQQIQKQRDRELKARKEEERKSLTVEQEAAQIAKIATQEELRVSGPQTPTDVERLSTDPKAKALALTDHFAQNSQNSETTEHKVSAIVEREDWYAFDQGKLPGHHMFGVKSVKGVLIVTLNIDHGLSEFLGVLEEQSADLNDPLARHAAVALRTLLFAWARLQDGIPDVDARAEVEHIAGQWGKHARKFLAEIAANLQSGAVNGE